VNEASGLLSEHVEVHAPAQSTHTGTPMDGGMRILVWLFRS